MKKLLSILFILNFLFSCTKAKKETEENSFKTPKLVVGIVVDQMRYDYLHRFYNKYSDNGFKRLMKNGMFCRNTHFNYIPTATGPGHASIYTGTTPSIHGIIGNDWYNVSSKEYIYCVQDDSVNTIGADNASGKFSPKNLMVPTVTDQLRLASNWKAKVVSLSIKNRASILPAGFSANGAYWFDYKTGNFISSSHYVDKLPQWVTDYNTLKSPDKYLNETWSTLLPIESYTESAKDDNRYEAILKGKESPTFPYDLKEMKKEYQKSEYDSQYTLFTNTPFCNTFLKDFAKQAISNEQLGKDSIPDFLAVSFSSTDIIGHDFGPQSIEIEDTYLRLDKDIADFINHLDKEVGNENYVLFLTADHAVLNQPNYLKDNKIPGGFIDFQPNIQPFKDFLVNQFGQGEWVEYMDRDHLFLNRQLIRDRKLNLANFQKTCADYLIRIQGVYKTFTADGIHNSDAQIGIQLKLKNSYNQKRSPDVYILHNPLMISSWYNRGGTTHGSAFNYDTHVPLIWYGGQTPTQKIDRHINITDIAATVSSLLNLQLPSGTTGQPIEEYFKD